MKVFVVTSQWENGRIFEGDLVMKVTKTQEDAKAMLHDFIEEAKECFTIAYDGVVITDENDHYCEPTDVLERDWWSGTIREFDI